MKCGESDIRNKKYQEKASLSPRQIILFGKLIGKDFKKFVNFKLSVKGTEFVGLKGHEIGKAIRNKEAELYNENVVPSPSRKGINKNKTDKLSGYKKVEESLPNKLKDKFKKLKNKPETDAGKDFYQHHKGSMGADKMGRLSEPDTYDWDDDDKVRFWANI